MKSKQKASVLTLISSIINSLLAVVFGLIYNNYVIIIYGSNANGLISALAQFVAFFSIIEGGFTTAAVVAVYNPLVKNDYKKLNDILYTSKLKFIRIGVVITISVLSCGMVYIRFVDSPFSAIKTCSLLIISVLTTSISLCFEAKYSILLQGSNKAYIQTMIATFCRTITWIISMGLIIYDFDIVLVYSINILNVALNVLILRKYEHKNYPYVKYRGEFHSDYIIGTSDVMLQKIANTIFTSTDLVLISIFIDLASASVYNLYFQVYRAVFGVLSAIAQAPFNSFGHVFNGENGRERIAELFYTYQHIILMCSTIMLTITCIIIIPFIKIYTSSITDYEYVYPSLAVLFFSQIYSQIINRPYGLILNVTGNFKMQNTQCIVAAIVNIVVSLAFIRIWGINSIVLGSFIATLIIVVMNIHQAYKNVLNQHSFKAIKNIILNYVIAILVISLSFRMNVNCSNYIELIIYTVVSSLTIVIMILFVNLLIDFKETAGVLVFVRKMIWRNGN